MQRVGDLTGQRFGKLVVQKLIGKDKYSDKIWECKCDCGNFTNVKQSHLRSGHTTSCGCKRQMKSLVGKRFGSLVVTDRTEDYICPDNGKHYIRWNCVCDCGNKVTVVANNLVSGSVSSCGCQNPHALKDLSGQVFGKLTVLHQVDSYVNPSGRKLIRYKCQCECGQYVLELANTLRQGEVLSCGCSLNSKGEMAVSKWLNNRKIKYELHKSFEDCLSTTGNRLNFDFYLPDLNALIECNGIQHYEPVEFFGGQERFENQKLNDKIKADYAKSKGFSYLVLDCRREFLSSIDTKLFEFLL